MAHLEMLIAKGEIRGPPYIMSDDQEFTFLRKFIERQRSNVPHNPRLRGLSQEVRTLSSTTVDLPRSETPDEPKASTSYTDDSHRLLGNMSPPLVVHCLLKRWIRYQRVKNVMLLHLHLQWPRNR
jgi:hypothetical protein